MEAITSRQNPHFRKLQALHKREERDASGCFLVEGEKELSLVKEIEILYYEEITPATRDLFKKARESVKISKELLEQISYRGCTAVAVCKSKLSSFNELSNQSLLLACEGIEKPGNLGAILRTADGAGVGGLIVADPVVDVFNPNVVRASLGALFCLPIVQTESEKALEFLEREHLQIIVTTPSATKLYYEVDFTKPTCIVIGSESKGLSPKWLKHKQAMGVKIPMMGHVDSLNASISASVVIYEALRQRSSLS